MSERESFWESECFAVVTDKTKPAMKWTIDELASRGKKVYVVDISGKPDQGTIQSISELPSNVDCAVIGLTKTNPANIMEDLEKKGIKRFWIHWRTETPEVKKKCIQSQIQCIIGRCPMMYLGHGFNMHTMHKGVARLFGKY
ncbi:MAG: CoA-binding protein [Methanotrichaceae archaeon]|nr:CoA-binding protein [Methanotrichaceae archaeon]